MKLFVIFFTYIVVEGLASIEQNRYPTIVSSLSSRIFNGGYAEKYQFPYQASLQYEDDNTHFCGGVVISENHILTAANCIQRHKIKIVLGLHDKEVMDDDVQTFSVKNVSMHPDYIWPLFGDDVAVIRLDRSINFTKAVRPIALPENDDDCEFSAKVKVSGWGLMKNQLLPKLLRWTSQHRITDEDCNERITDIIDFIEIFRPEKMSCTGALNNEGYKGGCVGDHGGPVTLTSSNKLVGIYSFDFSICGLRESPSIYTKICNYRNWIAEQMKQL